MCEGTATLNLREELLNSNYRLKLLRQRESDKMGVRLSIDKHVSNLHELLEMSAQYFQKVRFASKISGDIK